MNLYVAEYDAPQYGTGHADYRTEGGTNEFPYYPEVPAAKETPTDRRVIEKARAEVLELERTETMHAMLRLSLYTGYRAVAIALASATDDTQRRS